MNQAHLRNYIFVLSMLLALFVTNLFAQRTVENFNLNWRFTKGEQDQTVITVDFDDSSWQPVRLPHDWAIEGPFYEGWDVEVSGGMGRLPSPGVAWYRKKLDIPASDTGKSIFLDVIVCNYRNYIVYHIHFDKKGTKSKCNRNYSIEEKSIRTNQPRKSIKPRLSMRERILIDASICGSSGPEGGLRAERGIARLKAEQP